MRIASLPSRTTAAAACALLCALALPAAAQRVDTIDKGTSNHTLGGLDLDLTFWEISGLDTSPGAYENQALLIFEPRFRLGHRFFRNTWAEPLSVSARLFVEAELAGSDAAFRCGSFASPALFRDSPESQPIRQAQTGGAEGTARNNTDGVGRCVTTSDLWLSAFHGKLYTIPKLGIDLQAGARVVLPVSLESRNSGLQAAPSLYLALSKKIGRFNVEYGFRAVKYFYNSTTAPIAAKEGTVTLNGQEIQPYHIESTGDLNPNYAFAHFFGFGIELPANFSIEIDYLLFNLYAHRPPPTAVPGVPTADLDSDGDAVHDARRPGQRDSQWFYIEVAWRPVSWGAIGVGLSTFQPVRLPDGSLANPVCRVNRDNVCTVFLSLSVNAESLATALKKKR